MTEEEAQKILDDDLIDYARSQWDGRPGGPRTEYDEPLAYPNYSDEQPAVEPPSTLTKESELG